MVDLGQVEESAKALGPRFNLQKVENPLELNFDELYEAGYSNYDIADAVADEFDKDFQGFLDQGGNIDDFLYTYTNIAKPGSIGAFTDRLLRGLTKSTPITAGIVGGAKLGARVPYAQPAPTIAGATLGGLAGMTTGEEAVELGENLGFFETRPPFRQDRLFAITGDIIGEGLPLIPASRFFKQGAQTTAGFLVSQRLNKLPNFSVYRAGATKVRKTF